MSYCLPLADNHKSINVSDLAIFLVLSQQVKLLQKKI